MNRREALRLLFSSTATIVAAPAWTVAELHRSGPPAHYTVATPYGIDPATYPAKGHVMIDTGAQTDEHPAPRARLLGERSPRSAPTPLRGPNALAGL